MLSTMVLPAGMSRQLQIGQYIFLPPLKLERSAAYYHYSLHIGHVNGIL